MNFLPSLLPLPVFPPSTLAVLSIEPRALNPGKVSPYSCGLSSVPQPPSTYKDARFEKHVIHADACLEFSSIRSLVPTASLL